MSNLDQIGQQAADTMMRSAVAYVKKQGVKPTDTLIDRLEAELKARSSATIEAALKDAQQAVEAGLSGYASATFLATFSLAGIEAAKAAMA